MPSLFHMLSTTVTRNLTPSSLSMSGLAHAASHDSIAEYKKWVERRCYESLHCGIACLSRATTLPKYRDSLNLGLARSNTGSQSLTVPSLDPDATSLPSGENATAEGKWPLSVPRTAPVAGSQSLTVPSPDPDATSLPSGEKAT